MTYKLVKIKNNIINEIHLLLAHNKPVNIRKLLEEDIIQTDAINIPYTPEDHITSVDITQETVIEKIQEWKNETEPLPITLKEILKNSQHPIREYDISAFPRLVKTNNNKYKLCVIKINEVEKLQQILISSINHYLTRIFVNASDILFFMRCWEDFVLSNQTIEIKILENTLENWEMIFHPEKSPIKTCMTTKENYKRIAEFYTCLPEAKPCLLKRKNDDKIIGRTIVWDTENYGLCHDRIYTSLSKQNEILNAFKTLEIKNLYEPEEYMAVAFVGTLRVGRKSKPFIPFMDTMRSFAWIQKEKRRRRYTFIIGNSRFAVEMKAQEIWLDNMYRQTGEKLENRLKVYALNCTDGHPHIFED